MCEATIVFPDRDPWVATFDLILPEPGEQVEAFARSWLVTEVRDTSSMPRPAVLVSPLPCGVVADER